MATEQQDRGLNRLLPWRGETAKLFSGTIALIRELPRTSIWLTAASVIGLLAAAAAPLGFTVATGTVIGLVPRAAAGGPGSHAADEIVRALIVASGLFVAAQVLPSIRDSFVRILGRNVEVSLSRRVMTASLGPTGLSHLEDPDILNHVSLASGVGTGGTAGNAVGSLFGLAAQRLSAAGSAVLVSRYSVWWLGLLLWVSGIVLKSQLKAPLRKTFMVMLDQAHQLRRSRYHRTLATTPAAAKEIRIFSMADWILNRFRETWRESMDHVWAERRRGSRRMLWLLPPAAGLYVFALGYVAVLGVRHSISLASLAIAIQAVSSAIALNVGQEQALEAGAATMPHLSELEAIASDPKRAPSGSADSAGLPREEIRFNNVSFSYPGRDTLVFDNLELTIPAGKSIAIVGVNGAGKTTLVKLLARLYDPDSGSITADGTDLRSFDPSGWQRRVASIFQDFVRYELPARDNVGLGAFELLQDTSALDEAARRAGVDQIVDGLGNGWETVLHREYKDGADLSGGQWQRIAIARALFAVAGGAGVLVLDEPTAALDVRSEAELFDRFLEITEGVTTVLISHRFSTVRHADEIVVLEAGRVIERGTHDSLMASSGRYAEMFTLQAARFVEDAEAGSPSDV